MMTCSRSNSEPVSPLGAAGTSISAVAEEGSYLHPWLEVYPVPGCLSQEVRVPPTSSW
jgi:hypothetical protein